MPDYDLIIAGAGAAGLSLAYHLVGGGLAERSILLLDRAPKTANDRTWCFWEQGPGPFEALVFRRWEQVWFHGAGGSRRLELAPYTYKMLRGIDFYRFMSDWVARQPNLTVRYGEITHIEEADGGGRVWLDGKPLEARWVFSSLYQPPPRRPGRQYLLQHFKGWRLETPHPAFDPEAATFMDFRIPQNGETRFVYVLPLDPRQALVEYTVFSAECLRPEAYDAGLEQYLSQHLGLEPGGYTRLEQEFGVIPMTDLPLPVRQSPHVLRIGTAGGRTKPSTGYTFQRIQEQSRRIAESLYKTGQPFYRQPKANRYALFDSVLLEVLSSQRELGERVFADLFSKNPPARVLRFLDEASSLAEDWAILNSVNRSAFARGALEVLRHRLFGR